MKRRDKKDTARINKDGTGTMSEEGHIAELKHRIINCLIFFIIAFIIYVTMSKEILRNVILLGENIGYILIFSSPQAVLLQELKIAFVFALLTISPVILYHIFAYISPVFSHNKGKKTFAFFQVIGFILFILGGLFAIFVLLPFTYKYLFDIGQGLNIIPQVSIEEYVSLLLTIITCIGVVFETPLVCVILSITGVADKASLKSARKWVIVLSFVLAAIITPPDVISQIIVAIPIIALYQVSIFICGLMEKKNALNV